MAPSALVAVPAWLFRDTVCQSRRVSICHTIWSWPGAKCSSNSTTSSSSASRKSLLLRERAGRHCFAEAHARSSRPAARGRADERCRGLCADSRGVRSHHTHGPRHPLRSGSRHRRRTATAIRHQLRQPHNRADHPPRRQPRRPAHPIQASPARPSPPILPRYRLLKRVAADGTSLVPMHPTCSGVPGSAGLARRSAVIPRTKASQEQSAHRSALRAVLGPQGPLHRRRGSVGLGLLRVPVVVCVSPFLASLGTRPLRWHRSNSLSECPPHGLWRKSCSRSQSHSYWRFRADESTCIRAPIPASTDGRSEVKASCIRSLQSPP